MLVELLRSSGTEAELAHCSCTRPDRACLGVDCKARVCTQLPVVLIHQGTSIDQGHSLGHTVIDNHLNSSREGSTKPIDKLILRQQARQGIDGTAAAAVLLRL